MTSVNEPDHVLALLEGTMRASKRIMDAAMADRVPRLRSSYFRLMGFIPAEGIRLTELAARASMTKQALGEFVATLEEEGFVRSRPDPDDRRARLVAPTARGVELQQALAEAIERLEQEWRERVGPRRWATMRAVLVEIARSSAT